MTTNTDIPTDAELAERFGGVVSPTIQPTLLSTRGKKKPRRMTLIYGPNGVGKTELASEFEDAVILAVEIGSANYNNATDTAKSLNDIWEVLVSIEEQREEARGIQWVVIDTLDKLCDLAAAAVLKDHPNANGIEDTHYKPFAFMKGWASASEKIGTLLSKMDAVNLATGVNFVFTAQTKIKGEDNPLDGEWDRFSLNCNNYISKRVLDWVDISILLKGGTVKNADGTFPRHAYVEFNPAHVSKVRSGLALKNFVYVKGDGYGEIKRQLTNNGGK